MRILPLLLLALLLGACTTKVTSSGVYRQGIFLCDSPLRETPRSVALPEPVR